MTERDSGPESGPEPEDDASIAPAMDTDDFVGTPPAGDEHLDGFVSNDQSDTDSPDTDSPDTDNPGTDSPDTDSPDTDSEDEG